MTEPNPYESPHIPPEKKPANSLRRIAATLGLLLLSVPAASIAGGITCSTVGGGTYAATMAGRPYDLNAIPLALLLALVTSILVSVFVLHLFPRYLLRALCDWRKPGLRDLAMALGAGLVASIPAGIVGFRVFMYVFWLGAENEADVTREIDMTTMAYIAGLPGGVVFCLIVFLPVQLALDCLLRRRD